MLPGMCALILWRWVTHLSFPSWPAECHPRLGTQEQQPRCRRCRHPGSSGWWWWCLPTPPPVQQNGKTSVSTTTAWSNHGESPQGWSQQSCIQTFLSHHSFFSSWLRCVEDLVAADVAHRRIPADRQTVEGRVDHLQVLRPAQRIWEGGPVTSVLRESVIHSPMFWWFHEIYYYNHHFHDWNNHKLRPPNSLKFQLQFTLIYRDSVSWNAMLTHISNLAPA